MCSTVRRIVLWKRSTGRRRTPSLAGFASATPICGEGAPVPPAARAAAGKAMQAIRTGTKYVRFVSKRGTVAVFAASERDRAHTSKEVSAVCHDLRHKTPAAAER